jgi:hypothetical protein
MIRGCELSRQVKDRNGGVEAAKAGSCLVVYPRRSLRSEIFGENTCFVYFKSLNDDRMAVFCSIEMKGSLERNTMLGHASIILERSPACEQAPGGRLGPVRSR